MVINMKEKELLLRYKSDNKNSGPNFYRDKLYETVFYKLDKCGNLVRATAINAKGERQVITHLDEFDLIWVPDNFEGLKI